MRPILLDLAARAAVRRVDRRSFLLGAVGIRADGVRVTASNGPAEQRLPQAHAEARLCRKLTPHSVVYVARVLRSGALGNARPCPRCMAQMAARGVERVIYSTESGYSILFL